MDATAAPILTVVRDCLSVAWQETGMRRDLHNDVMHLPKGHGRFRRTNRKSVVYMSRLVEALQLDLSFVESA